MRNYFRRLFEHIEWSNKRILAHINSQTPREAVRLFSHVLAAEKVWLMRLRGEDSSVYPVWPDIGPDECAVLAAENVAGYAAYLDSLSDAQFSSIVAYRNTKGAEYTTAVQDIITHVALHGSYHRGQMMLALRSAGIEPTNVDFITFAR